MQQKHWIVLDQRTMQKEKKDLNIFKKRSLQFCITYVEYLGTDENPYNTTGKL